MTTDAAADVSAILDVAKWLLAPGVSLWLLRSIMALRDDVRDVKRDISGIDGKNGLKSKVNDHEDRLGVVEDRFVAIDAIAEVERAEYSGEERRHAATRKLIDMIRQEIRDEHKPPHTRRTES